MTVVAVAPPRHADVVVTKQIRVVTPFSLLRALLKRIKAANCSAEDVRVMERCVRRVFGAYLLSFGLWTEFSGDGVTVIVWSVNDQLATHLHEMCDTDTYERLKRHLRVS